MPIATGLALGLAGISAAGALGGAAMSANAAGKAASTQANAAQSAAQLQYQSEQQALQFQEQQWQQSQMNSAPWLQTGGSAELALGQLLGLPSPSSGITPGSPFPAGQGTSTVPTAPNPGMQGGGTNPGSNQFSMQSLTNPRSGGEPPMAGHFPMQNLGGGAQPGGSTGVARAPGSAGPGAPGAPGAAPGGGGMLGSNLQPFAPWTTPFTAPTDVTEQNDPGYKFRMSQGLGALENSAAARGGLLSGNTAKAEQDYAQGLASNEYGNVYNRSLGEYQQNYNIYQQNQAQQWNRLASLAGMGQTQAGQLNSNGMQMGSNVGNILLGSGAQIGQQMNNAAAATASGYVGGANAYGGALGSIGGNLGNLLLMSKLLGNGGSAQGPNTAGV